MESNLNQIKSDYIFTSKKSVVDFALGNSLYRITNEEKKLKNVRHKIGSKPYEHEYNLQIIRFILFTDFLDQTARIKTSSLCI